jgi:DNA mismatch repair protein MutS
MPLKEIKPINDRLGVVEYLIEQEELRETLQNRSARLATWKG